MQLLAFLEEVITASVGLRIDTIKSNFATLTMMLDQAFDYGLPLVGETSINTHLVQKHGDTKLLSKAVTELPANPEAFWRTSNVE